MCSSSLNQHKAALRKAIRARLGSLDQAGRSVQARQACDHALAWKPMSEADSVMAYFPMADELDISPMLEALLERGVQLSVPVTDWTHKRLTPRVVTDLDRDRIEGRHGVSEPREGLPLVPLEAIQVVVVPGVGFDVQGGRLGRGGGFYDRFLTELMQAARRTGRARPRRISVCFPEQIVPAVPMEEHDVRVDCLSSSQGLMEIHAA